MQTPEPTKPTRLRQAAGNFWLGAFFWICDHAPRLALAMRPISCAAAMAFSRDVRRGARANARYLLGAKCTRLARWRLLYRTLSSFYLFCFDVAWSRRATAEELRKRVRWAGGQELYRQARAAHRGMIVVTAHMGSFEVAMAELRAVEEHVHVLFRRDAVGLFEQQRSQLRKRLGIHEAALDDGWTVWIRLREALLNDQVVVIQGDRILPGQKGRPVPFLGGRLELPLAPFKLALATGASIVPIFTRRAPDGGIELIVKEPVAIDSRDDESRALLDWASLLEEQIAACPEQWLTLGAAWLDDGVPAQRRG